MAWLLLLFSVQTCNELIFCHITPLYRFLQTSLSLNTNMDGAKCLGETLNESTRCKTEIKLVQSIMFHYEQNGVSYTTGPRHKAQQIPIKTCQSKE